MKLFEYINEQEFNDMINLNYIKVTSHPTFNNYRIISYTRECNALKVWNDTTIKCRGLIIDPNDNIIAKPFKKFYNYEEYVDTSIIPTNLSFDVFEKLDGSLGILYWVNDVPYIATKGSFNSEQAIHATELLHTKYKNVWNSIDKDKTYLFEIIYPGDLHCCSYGTLDDIFLLAVIDTNNDNIEYNINDYKHLFTTTKVYDGISDWKNIRDIFSGDNREGFVVKFENNFRLKLKYEQYWKIHFLKAGFNANKILDCLINNDNDTIDKAFELFDEEHIIYYQRIIDFYKNEYSNIIDKCIEEFRTDFETKKDAAIYFKTCKYPHVLFAMYNKKDYSRVIWDIIKKYSKFDS